MRFLAKLRIQGIVFLPLCPVRVLFLRHLFHSHAQPAVFGKAHVLLLHVFLAAVGELVAPEVDLVAEVAHAADYGEEDYQGYEGGEGAHGRLWVVWLLERWLVGWTVGALVC